MKRQHKARSDPTIHDRIAMRATQLPAHAEIAVVPYADPYERGKLIHAAASLRGDPLLALHARHQIADFEFVAGRTWQRYYEQAAIGGSLKSANLTMEPVDGGGFSVEFLTDSQKKAVAKLTYCRAILGENGNTLVTLILGNNLPIAQAALARGFVSRRDVEYCGKRFREALGDLAKVFRLA